MTERWSISQFRDYQARTLASRSIVDAGVPRLRRAETEYREQVQFFALVELLALRHPDAADELLDVFSTSSGGKRDRATAGKLREAGQRAGIPDIEVFVPKHGFHGLVIELKPLDSGRPTPAQRDRLARLNVRGYHALLCHGWIQAGKSLCEYLSLSWPDNVEKEVADHLALRQFKRKVARKAKQQAARSWPSKISHSPF